MHVAISYSFSPSDNDFKARRDNPRSRLPWYGTDGRNAFEVSLFQDGLQALGRQVAQSPQSRHDRFWAQVEFGSEIWAVNMDSELRLGHVMSSAWTLKAHGRTAGFRLGPFPGKLAEFRVWDHARAADEARPESHMKCISLVSFNGPS